MGLQHGSDGAAVVSIRARASRACCDCCCGVCEVKRTWRNDATSDDGVKRRAPLRQASTDAKRGRIVATKRHCPDRWTIRANVQ